MPTSVHSDRGTAFILWKLKDYLQMHENVTHRTTPYYPQGNGKCKRLNGTLWSTVSLALETRGLPVENWEQAQPKALHSIRHLLGTTTNCYSHENMLPLKRRSASGQSFTSWLLTTTRVLMKRHNVSSKYADYFEEADALRTNSSYFRAYTRR